MSDETQGCLKTKLADGVVSEQNETKKNTPALILPIFQGPTLLGVLPYLNARHDPRWRCNQNMTQLYLSSNFTDISPDDNAWDDMWRKVQGSLLVAAAIEALLGLTGLVGLISKAVRPVTIANIFLLIGVYLWKLGSDIGNAHWGIALGSLGVCGVFALYIDWIPVPVPTWNRQKGCSSTKLKLFQLFPILLAILIMWPLSHIITVVGGFSNNSSDPSYYARTDIYEDTIANAPPIRFPYPGHLGGMSFDAGLVAFYIPCLLASAIESIADYYQYALACQVPPPPDHALNRGILVEGLGGLLSAGLGAGHPTTSYSNMMGIITITGVGSRVVMCTAGVFIAVMGIIGPVGAVLVAIPQPVLFGPLVLSLAMLVGSAFYNLESVDLSLRRNQSILGISFFLGVVAAFHLEQHPFAIGSAQFNDIATGILKIPFITGGIISVFLDLTLPGKAKEKSSKPHVDSSVIRTIYDPPLVGNFMRRHLIFNYIPFFPSSPVIKQSATLANILFSDLQSTDL